MYGELSNQKQPAQLKKHFKDGLKELLDLANINIYDCEKSFWIVKEKLKRNVLTKLTAYIGDMQDITCDVCGRICLIKAGK